MFQIFHVKKTKACLFNSTGLHLFGVVLTKLTGFDLRYLWCFWHFWWGSQYGFNQFVSLQFQQLTTRIWQIFLRYVFFKIWNRILIPMSALHHRSRMHKNAAFSTARPRLDRSGQYFTKYLQKCSQIITEIATKYGTQNVKKPLLQN